MRRGRALALVAAVAVACGGTGSGGRAAAPPPLKGSLVMTLMPSNQAPQVLATAQPITDYISHLVGVPVTAQVPAGYAAVVDGLTSGEVDIAWVSALAYLAVHHRSGADVVTASARCAPTYTASPPSPGCTPRPSYPAMIICNVGSGVGELKDGRGDWLALKGKRFAFGDAISTSSTLWPRYYLKQNHVDPDKDFAKTVSISNPSGIALDVYNGTADCGAMFGDARTGVIKTAPDVLSKTKVVFLAPQEIPGDPQVVRHNLNPAQKKKVEQALIKLGSDPAMKKALNDLYAIASMEPVKDSDYDSVRRVVAGVNPNLPTELISSPTPSPSKAP